MNASEAPLCARTPDRFAGFLDGELQAQDGHSLEVHLETCVSCREQARELAALHRDLILRSVGRETSARDPIPAMIARIRWTAAAARRPRRAAIAPAAADSRLIWMIAALAAALLLACVGFHQGSEPARIRKPEPLPLVEFLPPAKPVPAPAPRIESPAAPAPPVVLPRREEVLTGPAEEPMPAPWPTTPRSAPTLETPLGIARIEGSGQTPRTIVVGETLVADSRAVIVYPDGTRLFTADNTSLTFEGRGKAISIARGEVFAEVTPQPRDEPMTFATAGAEIKVVGTWLSVACRRESTVVTVEKGRVQVTRKADRWSVQLREGQTATVEAGRLPIARTLPPNLAADPGFEADGKGWEGIFNRPLGRNFGGISVAKEIVHTGSRSVQLVTQPTIGYDREIYQDFPVVPGEPWEAAAWLRSAGIGGKGVTCSLMWLGSGANLGSDPTSVVRQKGLVIREDIAGTLTGTNDWKRVATRAVAPPPSKQVRLLIYADVDPGGPATAWIDDLILRRYQKGKPLDGAQGKSFDRAQDK